MQSTSTPYTIITRLYAESDTELLKTIAFEYWSLPLPPTMPGPILRRKQRPRT